MLINAGFEEGPGSAATPPGWGKYGQCGQESWAAEDGTNGVAFHGWNSGGGGFYQTGMHADTNACYYLRIRGRGEPQFASCDIEIKLEFYQADEATLVGAYTNIYPSSAADIWESYMITGAAFAGTERVRPVIAYPDRAPTGWGSQAYKWDNAQLYDRTLHYRNNEIAEEFSYDPDYTDSLDDKDRGGGFTNNWAESNPGSFLIVDGDFSDITGYPATRGNQVSVEVSGNSATRTARRQFRGFTNGVFYFSSYINFKWGEQNDKWMGLSVMSNGTELAFVGAKGVSNKPGYLNLVLDNFGGSTVDDDYEFHDNNDDYILCGRYNFATRELAAKAYWAGPSPDTIPYLEPTEWDVVATVAAGRIEYINGIRLGAGNSAAGSTCGPCHWDEVRVAADWHDLLNTLPPSTNWAFDRFNYAADTPLHLASGGGDYGFTIPWQNSNYCFTNRAGDINAPVRYPTPTNNMKVEVRPGYNNRWDISAYRQINAITNGRIYGAFLMRYEWGGPEKYVVMDFVSNSTTIATFGRVFSSANTNVLGLDTAVPRLESHYELHPALDGSQDYLVIGCYDFMTRHFRAMAYHSSAKMPLNEPLAENWGVNATVDVDRIQFINAIRIKAGGMDPATPGQTYFDEVRIARSWNQLLETCWKPPEGSASPADFDVGGTKYLTDADITGGTYNISMKITDPDGLNTVSNTPGHFTPVFDIQNARGRLLLTNQTWDTMTYADYGTTLFLTSRTHAVAAAPEINFGTYTIRWSVEDSNDQYVAHGTRMADGSNTTFTVYDDDIIPPVATLLYVGTDYSPGAVSNQVTDGDLADGGSIDVAVNLSDPSGIWFASNNFTNIDSPLGNVQPNWDLTNSLQHDFGLDVIFTNFSGDSTCPSVTAIVYNIASVDPADITLSTWGLTISAQDHDADRGVWAGINASEVQWDRAILTNQMLSFNVVDDDTNAPLTRTLDDASATWGVGAGSKYMVAATNGVIISDRSSDGSSVVYRVTDGYMADLSGGQTLQFAFGAIDADSGISASSAGVDTNEYISMSIENGFSGNMSAFDAAESSSDAAGVVRTNVFTFDDRSIFTDTVISNLIMSA
ncbi:MAG: hypothetical protein EOM20_14065, partial [Spartobacteria bacterium]|nr:hypothetical protein [Spartobacteria bacterium]